MVPNGQSPRSLTLPTGSIPVYPGPLPFQFALKCRERAFQGMSQPC
jgi:hypothetical protein